MRVLSSRASRESEFHGSFGQCSVLSLAMPQSLIASTPFEDFWMTSISSDLLSFCSNLQCLGVLRSFCPPCFLAGCLGLLRTPRQLSLSGSVFVVSFCFSLI